MIKISVDEAYAFDYLSILQVKKLHLVWNESKEASLKRDQLQNTIRQVRIEIENDIGTDKFFKIINSTEYDDLVKANDTLYTAIAYRHKYSANYMHDLNEIRHHAKITLQNTFFSTLISEVKNDY
jgi:hypothetical protein